MSKKMYIHKIKKNKGPMMISKKEIHDRIKEEKNKELTYEYADKINKEIKKEVNQD